MQKINGIAVFETGAQEGKPIVLVHGFPFSHAMWDPQVQALSKTFRVITYDVRGHGASDAVVGPASIDLFVDDLIQILDTLVLPRVALCGLSMGGYIALRALERYPSRFYALILCDTKSKADTEEGRKKRMLTAEVVKKSLVPSYAEESVKALFSDKTMHEKKDVVEFIKQLIRGNTVDGIVSTLMALAGRPDTTPALAQMRLPALIMTGEEDKITPPAEAQDMASALPDAQLYLIPGVAHLSNLEDPKLFNEKLTTFLNNLKETP